MKRERALVTSILIDKTNQVHLFQVRLPRETEYVFGVEMGLRSINRNFPDPPKPGTWKLPLLVNRNVMLGELKLQSLGKANIFYAEELKLDLRPDFADFSSLHWTPRTETHDTNRYEDEIAVGPESSLLKGVYRDRLSEMFAPPYSYRVDVYVWIKTKSNKTN